jgi:membrane-associated protease RseP (regulator of RpoE activity)
MPINSSKKTLIIQVSLLITTVVTTTIAGAEWMYAKSLFFGTQLLSMAEVVSGLYFAGPFLTILAVHEFGHYFTARHNRIKVSLPYFIPLWLGFVSLPSIGTMGAFIRLYGNRTRREFFDVGVAGPLAGFVVALLVLSYGFTHLPEADYIYEIHPEYREYGENLNAYYEQQEANFAVGDNLLFLFFKNYVADPDKVPNRYELYHYPWIFAGYLALFFTALNLLPIGQLDGGHVIFGLFGHRRSRIISRVLFFIMVSISGIGLVPMGEVNAAFALNAIFYLLFLFLAFHHFEKDLRKRALIVIWVMILQVLASHFWPTAGDYGIYLVFAFVFGRFLGIDHPRAVDDKPLDLKRKVIGWLALIVFIISFTPRPIYFEINKKARIEEPGPVNQKTVSLKIVAGWMVK